MDTGELCRVIHDELALNPDIRGDIEVEIADGVVRLTGVVSSPRERRLAETIARRLGAKSLQVDISLESGEATSRGLRRKIEAALSDAGLSEVAGVQKIVDGVVYLKGHASSASEAERAVNRATGISGVRDVVSNITLTHGMMADNATLVNEVEQAIAEAGLHIENVTTSVRNGLVKLEGIVWKAHDREKAAAAAKSVSGVRGVVNHLRAPTEPLSDDDRLAWEVLRRLESASINVVNLSAVVSAGTVFLDGSVDSEPQRDEAGSIALKTPGIDHIENDLSVSSASGSFMERRARQAGERRGRRRTRPPKAGAA